MLSGVSTTDKKTTFTTVFHGLRLTANKYVIWHLYFQRDWKRKN
ncbi:hypothetical protein L798_15126 [Zootermopsis nevadensis]|uniref:Uncharacterized protein n=1 Tax=Zootermopsis nevadensis TaxID=136037 RepID=A0A067RHD4_ZOONE|nr:hypothetical protein L798_15126 [Zootermopsis nevadensis]